MPRIRLTKDNLQEIAEIASALNKLVIGYRDIVAAAPEEMRPKMELNGVNKLRSYAQVALDYAQGFSGKFETWERQSNAIKGRSAGVEVHGAIRKKRTKATD